MRIGLFPLSFFALLLTLSAWAATTERAPAAVAAGRATPHAPVDALGAKLQAFLIDAKSQLGPLKPWQEKIFNEEVLDQYKRFILDYRASSTGVEAEADMDAIRKYLRFYGPDSLKRENPTILVDLKHQADCEKCEQEAPALKQLVVERLKRRGLKIVWVKPQDLANPDLTGHELNDAVNQLAAQDKAVGALVVQWHVGAVDEENETHYLIDSYLTIRDVNQYEEKLDLMDTGSFEASEAKLLTDTFTDVGDKLEQLEVNHSELNRDEIQVVLNGFQSFAEYSAARDGISDALKNNASVEERRIGRGTAVLSVFTNQSIQNIRTQLAALKLDGVSFSNVAIQGQEIQVGIGSKGVP